MEPCFEVRSGRDARRRNGVGNHGQFERLDEGASLKDLVREFEKSLIVTALKKSEWNQKKAAGLLRVNPTTLNEKLKRLEITIP